VWKRFLLDEIEESAISTNEAAVWYLGGAGIAVKGGSALIYIDPYFGGSPSREWLRLIAVPVDPDEVRVADAVLSTHEHGDHCHRDTVIPVLRRTQAVFIGPRSSAARAKSWLAEENLDASRVIEVEPGSVVEVKGLRVRALASGDANAESAVTYLIETPGGNLFHGGDTQYFPGLADIGDRFTIDAAFISVGRAPRGRRDYMTACEAVKAALDLKAKILVPMHYDLWKATREDPQLVEHVAKVWRAPVEVVVLSLGDSLRLRKHLPTAQR
jgi:L-ascorbate 6-phosphate lactonase